MSPAFYVGNRRRLESIVGENVIVLSANSQLQRAADSAYEFQQEPNFWYLTGINEPDWILIISPLETLLVAPKVSETRAVFDGVTEHDTIREHSGVDRIIAKGELKSILEILAGKYGTVNYLGEDPHRDYYDFTLNPGPTHLLPRLRRLFQKQNDIRLDIARLRAIKQKEELDVMRDAITITSNAFTLVHDRLAAYETENHIAATFTYEFMRHANVSHGYTPIVAAGKHALTLHYVDNNAPLPTNGLVLLDIGAKKDGYSADITRTYAVGEVSVREREVHKAVEAAHHAIIALLGPDVSVKKYHAEVDRIMIEALKSLGLYHQKSDYRKYFPHAISHGLGVDVHDPLGAPKVFLPGMVLTVEPGIYIPEEGIGVRIEDDILITKDGYENLSASLPTGL